MKPSPLRVEDLMTTAVIRMREGETIGMAQLEMHLAQIRHLPVTDHRDHVVGIVSDRDLLRAARSGHQNPMKIGEIMTRKVETVRMGTPAHVAADLMLSKKIGALPVVGDAEQLVGILTETDFLEVARQALRAGKAAARDELPARF